MNGSPDFGLIRLADLIFPELTETDTVESLEKLFPPRSLKQGAKVTRIAPSPTGSMHIGNLYGALADERTAHSTEDGVFLLRIEDTDDKREVPGAVEKMIRFLSAFGLQFDEGATAQGDKGAYGPYWQRRRVKYYHIVARRLLLEGRAYPCFCSEEELKLAHEKQQAEKENFGYYGKWAVHRDMPYDQAARRIENGDRYVLRFRSQGDPQRKTGMEDRIKGKLSFPENDQDFVLLKSDGIPTYHFAHVVDDHFMRVTDVIRGEEWLSTLPWHLELFAACGFKPPRYAHTAQVLKLDEETGTKRKMSKRKDPELALSYYFEKGFPAPCVIEYLMTLLNSNFEQWRAANPKAPISEFPFSVNKMSRSGALFDLSKLTDVSKNILAGMTAEQVYDGVLTWAKEFDPAFYALLVRDEKYAIDVFSIGRGGKKPRKDFACYSEVKDAVSYFFDELFQRSEPYPDTVPAPLVKEILQEYLTMFQFEDDQNTWFGKIKALSERHGYTADMKAYKANPDQYAGSVSDISTVIRVALTGRQNSPDLFAVLHVLGKDRTLRRLRAAAI